MNWESLFTKQASHGMTVRVLNTAQLNLWQSTLPDGCGSGTCTGTAWALPELSWTRNCYDDSSALEKHRIGHQNCLHHHHPHIVWTLMKFAFHTRFYTLPFMHSIYIYILYIIYIYKYYVHIYYHSCTCIPTNLHMYSMYTAYTRYIHMAPNGDPGLWRLQHIRSWMLRRPEWSGW